MTPTTEKYLQHLTFCLISLRIIGKLVVSILENEENESAESSSSPTAPETDDESTSFQSGIDSKGVGLGIIDALFDEDDENSEDSESNPESPRILLGVQVKSDSSSSSSSSESPETSSVSETEETTTNSQDETLEPPIVILSNLSAREMMMSEEYTRVTFHGPNPRVVHMYRNCIVHNSWFEDESSGSLSSEEEEGEGESFVRFCHFCNKRINYPEDIFMLRDEKAFCSSYCRYDAILKEKEEKILKLAAVGDDEN